MAHGLLAFHAFLALCFSDLAFVFLGGIRMNSLILSNGGTLTSETERAGLVQGWFYEIVKVFTTRILMVVYLFDAVFVC